MLHLRKTGDNNTLVVCENLMYLSLIYTCISDRFAGSFCCFFIMHRNLKSYLNPLHSMQGTFSKQPLLCVYVLARCVAVCFPQSQNVPDLSHLSARFSVLLSRLVISTCYDIIVRKFNSLLYSKNAFCLNLLLMKMAASGFKIGMYYLPAPTYIEGGPAVYSKCQAAINEVITSTFALAGICNKRN